MLHCTINTLNFSVFRTRHILPLSHRHSAHWWDICIRPSVIKVCTKGQTLQKYGGANIAKVQRVWDTVCSSELIDSTFLFSKGHTHYPRDTDKEGAQCTIVRYIHWARRYRSVYERPDIAEVRKGKHCKGAESLRHCVLSVLQRTHILPLGHRQGGCTVHIRARWIWSKIIKL